MTVPTSLRRTIALLGILMTASLAAVWFIGYLAAPMRLRTLTSVRLGQPGHETKLTGYRFDCSWDAAQSAQRCVGTLEERALVLTFSARACSARWGERPLSCRLDYGAVPGWPSVRLDMQPLHARKPSVAALVDCIGTLSECEWGLVSRLTLLVILGWVLVAIWGHVSSGKKRWMYLAGALLALPVLFFALFLWNVHLGYAD